MPPFLSFETIHFNTLSSVATDDKKLFFSTFTVSSFGTGSLSDTENGNSGSINVNTTGREASFKRRNKSSIHTKSVKVPAAEEIRFTTGPGCTKPHFSLRSCIMPITNALKSFTTQQSYHD